MNLNSSYLFVSDYLISLTMAIITLLVRVCSCCEYAHIDMMHTMCVFAPRMCAHKKLIRKYAPVVEYLVWVYASMGSEYAGKAGQYEVIIMTANQAFYKRL